MRKFLERQGFDLDPEGRIRPKADTALAAAATMPRSLSRLRDPEMILESFERINRALPNDPAQAIGSAKELVEATAKSVLEELGAPFDDKTVKLPWLIDRAQRELGLHPQTAAAGPDGSQAVKRILVGCRVSRSASANCATRVGAPVPPPAVPDSARATATLQSGRRTPGAR